MTNTWITADSHFGHSKIIEYCNRPFSDVNEMNSELIKRWNSKISDDDVVYVLGDFSFRDGDQCFHQLKGNKHLIVGNHDGDKILSLPWLSRDIRLEIKLPDKTGKKHTIIMDHYPMESWNHSHRESLHFHGHVHGRVLNPIKNRVDVGVDCWNFYPVSLDEILEKVSKV